MRKAGALILMSALTFGPQGAFAQQMLPVINVYGTWYGNWNGWGPDERGNGGVPTIAYVWFAASSAQVLTLKNVRCGASGDLRNVTSMNDSTDRWMAAEQVYRSMIQTQSMWKRWIGISGLQKGDIYEVTFADGGKESYLISTPGFSMVTPGAGMPGSLVLGDGMVHKHAICK